MYATQKIAMPDIAVRRNAQNRRDHVAGVIQSTTDYAQFKFDALNRSVDLARLEILKSAITERNLLADNPIIVTHDYTVLDGQYRLTAAMELGLTIYYYFANDATIEDMPAMNGIRTSWKGEDYLEAWCKRGKPDYIALRAFYQRFDWMTFSMARDLCHFGDNIGANKRFFSGDYTANDLDFAERVALAVLDFRAIGFEYWRTSLFVRVVANLLSNADYDHKRMIHQLRRQSMKLRPAVDRDGYMEIMTRIYNYNRRGSTPVELKFLMPSEAKYRIDKKK